MLFSKNFAEGRKMLYQIKNCRVELGSSLILKNISFEIRKDEKIAIVGRNGSVKSTLLKAILGEVDLIKNDEDSVIAKSGRLTIGCLRQHAFEDYSISVDEEMQKVFLPIIEMKNRLDSLLEKIQSSEEQDPKALDTYTRLQEELESIGGYYYEKEYNLMLCKFGFSLEDKKRPLCEFSGGQLTKLAFIKLLISKPDILLLDEPTNHLDITTVEWLEEYLKSYKRAVVIVSHDRMFIDNIADVVYEIEYGETKRYVGNYTKFIKEKEENYERTLKAYKAQRAEIARLEALIERFRETPTKVAMTESKMKQIEHMVKIDEPRSFDTKSFHAHFTPKRDTGKEVLTITDLEIGYDKPLCRVNMKQYKRQRVGIIGGNGLGKSTLVKTLMSAIPSLSGSFSFGFQVDIGYFDQQMISFNSSKTVLDELWDEYPELSQTQARGALGAFMFTGDDVFKTIDMLSGGEKVRLALCKILQRKPNFLILDEPTNHMDMIGKEALEKMLSEFEGSLLFVSHDRYFVKKLAQSLLVFEGGTATYLPYTYDEYLEKRAIGALFKVEEEQPKGDEPIKRGKEEYNLSKEQGRLRRRYQRVNEKIDELEALLSEKQGELSSEEIASDYQRLCTLTEEIEALENELLSLMEEAEQIEKALN